MAAPARFARVIGRAPACPARAGWGVRMTGAGSDALARIRKIWPGSKSNVAVTLIRGMVTEICLATLFSVADGRALAAAGWISTDSVVPISRLGQDWFTLGLPR